MPVLKSRRSGIDLRTVIPPVLAAPTKWFGLVDDIGVVTATSIRHSAKAVRQQAIDTEREYMLLEDSIDTTDEQIWRRLKRQGYRVIPVIVKAL